MPVNDFLEDERSDKIANLKTITCRSIICISMWFAIAMLLNYKSDNSNSQRSACQ